MESKTSSSVPILPDQLVEFKEYADLLIQKSQGVPPKKPANTPVNTMSWSESSTIGTPVETLSLLLLAKEVGKEKVIIPDTVNTVLLAVRDAVCIGQFVSQQYKRASGLENLSQIKQQGKLPKTEEGTFFAKNAAMAAAGLFATASYMLWKLGSYKEEEVSGVSLEIPVTPEINLTQYPGCFNAFVYQLAYMVQRVGRNSELFFLKTAIRFAEAVVREMKLRVGALQHKEFFTEQSYQLKGTDFVVNGFEEMRPSAQVGVEFRRVSFVDIVGNREAKHEARRLAQRMLCYDFKERKNPFIELGGIQLVRMGYGKPGTGKSLQIAATATLMSDYCKNLGYPFLFWPLPDNVVSTFQGGSAERMADWMKRLSDHNKIIYASIDDGENNLEDRTRQVSAGVREVIGVFLRYTEGAYAIVRGNAVLEIFTNLPEQIDKAVLSRIQSRFAIDGAVNAHDFADQDHLWWRKLEKIDPNFVNMKHLDGYNFLDDQAEVKSLGALENGEVEPEDPRVLEIYRKLQNHHSHSSHEFFAQLFEKVQKVYPLFTSRDVRNVQTAVSARIMDFDMPNEWFENPEAFTAKPYAEKLEMIKELMRSNMKGLTFAEIRLREAIKYLNNMTRIVNVDFERRVDEGLKLLEVHEEVRNRKAKPLSA